MCANARTKSSSIVTIAALITFAFSITGPADAAPMQRQLLPDSKIVRVGDPGPVRVIYNDESARGGGGTADAIAQNFV